MSKKKKVNPAVADLEHIRRCVDKEVRVLMALADKLDVALNNLQDINYTIDDAIDNLPPEAGEPQPRS